MGEPECAEVLRAAGTKDAEHEELSVGIWAAPLLIFWLVGHVSPTRAPGHAARPLGRRVRRDKEASEGMSAITLTPVTDKSPCVCVRECVWSAAAAND